MGECSRRGIGARFRGKGKGGDASEREERTLAPSGSIYKTREITYLTSDFRVEGDMRG